MPVMAAVFSGNNDVCSNKKLELIMRELVHGHQLANNLKALLQKPRESNESDFSSACEDLAVKIHSSFTHCISLLTSAESEGEICENLEVYGVENASQRPHAFSDDRRSEDSNESRKPQAAALKSRRGCYKRRKTLQTWTTTQPTIEDGRAWRKYGQKEILNSKHPRSYYRCTRKYDQGCKATRQIQRMEENPEKYHITYIGFHTCRQIAKTPQMMMLTSSSSDCDQHSFEHVEYLSQQHCFPSTSVPTIQQDTATRTIFAAADDDSFSLLDSCCQLWPEINEVSAETASGDAVRMEFADYNNGNDLQCSFADSDDHIWDGF